MMFKYNNYLDGQMKGEIKMNNPIITMTMENGGVIKA